MRRSIAICPVRDVSLRDSLRWVWDRRTPHWPQPRHAIPNSPVLDHSTGASRPRSLRETGWHPIPGAGADRRRRFRFEPIAICRSTDTVRLPSDFSVILPCSVSGLPRRQAKDHRGNRLSRSPSCRLPVANRITVQVGLGSCGNGRPSVNTRRYCTYFARSE